MMEDWGEGRNDGMMENREESGVRSQEKESGLYPNLP